MKQTSLVVMLLVVALNKTQAQIPPTLRMADSVYELKDNDFKQSDSFANAKYIDEALSLYRSAWKDNPDNQVAWKLMRALNFKASFTRTTHKQRKQLYTEAKKIGEQGIQGCGSCVETYAWLAIVVGAWGQEHGIVRCAFAGVANKIKRYAETVIKTDSTYYDGAGFTILGGINLFAPKIPVILPWPSKKRALFLLQKSYALNKENPLICRFLAEALYSEGKVDEAKAIATQALSSTQVSSDGFVEDTFTKRTIKKLLAAWK